MESAERKSERMDAIIQLLVNHPWGFTRADLSRKLGVSKATMGRYITELSSSYQLRENDHGKIFIEVQKGLLSLRLSLHEIMVLYLSSILMSDQVDRKNFHAASALRKLAKALENPGLEKTSPLRPGNLISAQILREADFLDGPDLPEDKKYLASLEALTIAWAKGKKARIRYFSRTDNMEKDYILGIYAILPYAAGRTLHVLGLCEGEKEIRVFRVDLVSDVELLEDTYVIPETFNTKEHFKHAWGIWHSGKDPSVIKIKFSQQVAARVLETRWHVTESTQASPDGTLVWTAVIAQWREMIPWVRGWGADAEVLEPVEFREFMKEQVNALSRIYK